MATKDKNTKKSMEKKPAQKTLKEKAAGQEGEEVAGAESPPRPGWSGFVRELDGPGCGASNCEAVRVSLV